MAHVTEKEVKTATALAARKAGVTRVQLAEKLKIKLERAKGVLRKAMKTGGKWTTAPLGKGKENRTSVFRCAT